MLVGYARTSTTEQTAGFEAQIRDLKAAGCEEVFSEQVSSVAHRQKLIDAMHFVRKGDTLVVSKLDRTRSQHVRPSLDCREAGSQGLLPGCPEHEQWRAAGHEHRYRQADADRSGRSR